MMDIHMTICENNPIKHLTICRPDGLLDESLNSFLASASVWFIGFYLTKDDNIKTISIVLDQLSRQLLATYIPCHL